MATDKVQGVYDHPFTGKRYMSNTAGYVVDMICEDNISGLAHEDYIDNGLNDIGTIGFTAGVRTEAYHSDPNNGELASIYWNKTPIFDKEAKKFNYSSVDVITNQQTVSQDGLTSRRLVQINEKLRGLERKTGDTIEFANYPRYYTIRNKYCNKAIINLRVNSLGKLDKDPGTSNVPNETYGQLLDSDVTVNIDYKAMYSLGTSSSYRTGGKVEIRGSLSSPYMKTFELSLPLNAFRNQEDKGTFIGWQIRVYKNKEEPTTPDVRNEVFVDNIVEETEDTFVYPKTYVIKNTFEAENFSSIPDRAYDMNLLKVKIPSNYDPITRTYHDVWDGTFSTESTGPYGSVNGSPAGASRSKGKYWTDNPAWCFYDLITNKRYGLGRYVDTSTLDKWTLYEIAQYCDELVEDYDNGLEPRFSCNIIIESREDAYQVLNDMASIFRGIVYYNGGNLFAVQDALKNPIFQFNNTSVENGEFKYSSTSSKVRHTVAIIRYNDKNNKFEPAVEYVEDVAGIRKYGIKEKTLSAFGCTSKSQAQRLGRWVLSTEANETETVSFSCGQEGAILRPGDVFSVSDSNRAMTRRGGRIKALERVSDSIFKIALDSKLAGGKFWDGQNFVSQNDIPEKREYQLTVSTPSFYYDTSQVNLTSSSEIDLIRNKQIQTFNIWPDAISYDANSGVSVLTVSGNLNETSWTTSGFSGEALWGIASTGVDNSAETFFEKLPQEQEYRVINISEAEKGKYDVSAAEYSRVKYTEIDQATKPVNNINFKVPSEPSSMSDISMTDVVGASSTKLLSFSWGESSTNPESVSYYQIYIRKGAAASETAYDSTIRVYSINALSSDFIPASNGEYYVSIFAYNVLGQSNGSSISNNKTVFDVAPVKDVQISHAGLIDNLLGGGTSKVSDPTTQGVDGIDQFEDSTARFKWQTSLPQVQGANIALNFQYKLNVYDQHSPSTSNRVRSLSSYKPDDAELSLTTFSYTLADNYSDHSNSYDSISRKLTLEVFAVDENGVSSEAEALGGDLIKVENPEPSKPLTKETNGVAPIEGFIDLDNHIRIFNLNRASDVKELVILSGPQSFTYNDYVTSNSSKTIDLKRISADVDVVQIKPSWAEQTSGGEAVEAFFMLAYIDQFDLDVEKLAVANGHSGTNGDGSFDLTKKLASRISDEVKIEKVTQETIDLLGEGWKAWIQIDVDGKWYGRNIECVQDITDGVDDYKGYLPFYCTRKAPLMMNDGQDVIIGAIQTPFGLQYGVNYSIGCNYYLPDGPSQNDDYPSEPTRVTDVVGGPTNESSTIATTNEFWRNDGRNMTATKGFKRYRVFLKQRRDNPYWVVGMNANNEKYYNDDLLVELDSFFNGNATPTWADDFKAGATDALSAANSDINLQNKTQIGSSDGYFNFHPAGFVQGFGGLQRQPTYFDIQMGHMIDKSYLSKAIFFLMGTTEETKNSNDAKKCPTACAEYDCSNE